MEVTYTMRCIARSPFLPSLPHPQHNHNLIQSQNLLRLRSHGLCSRPPALISQRTNAVSDLFCLAATSPQKSGDISVFLQTAGVLLFAYWVANFLVPDLISKYLGFDKMGEEDQDKKKPQEDRADKEDQGTSSQSKKRGFNSTRARR